MVAEINRAAKTSSMRKTRQQQQQSVQKVPAMVSIIDNEITAGSVGCSKLKKKKKDEVERRKIIASLHLRIRQEMNKEEKQKLQEDMNHVIIDSFVITS